MRLISELPLFARHSRAGGNPQRAAATPNPPAQLQALLGVLENVFAILAQMGDVPKIGTLPEQPLSRNQPCCATPQFR
jgi:hypothetical protein